MSVHATVRAMVLAGAAVVALGASAPPGNVHRPSPSDRVVTDRGMELFAPPTRPFTEFISRQDVSGPTRFVGGVALGGAEALNARRPADYRAMRQANATWVRSDLDWRWLEETRAHWNWNLYDPVVADATAAGLSFVAILHTVPDWANGGAGAYAPPSDLSLLTNYCYQTSRHYIPLGVTTYEIGNEVNLPHPGWLAPTGAMYTRDLLAPCVTGVRQAAAELNTSVNVLLGSLVPTDRDEAAPVTFLAEVYANGGQGRFDNASMHPYTGPEGPAASDHLTTYAQRLHDVMTSHGDGAKRIWATEIGYPTGGADSVTEQQQADYVNLAIDLWYANSFAGPLFWYSARDTGTDPSNREAHYGVLRNDGSPKPAYSALTARLTR